MGMYTFVNKTRRLLLTQSRPLRKMLILPRSPGVLSTLACDVAPLVEKWVINDPAVPRGQLVRRELKLTPGELAGRR